MVLRKRNQIYKIGYFHSAAADLKKYVFINLRKQIRQKTEGISAI